MTILYLFLTAILILCVLRLRKENKAGYLPLEMIIRSEAKKRAKNTIYENWQINNFEKIWKCYNAIAEPHEMTFSEFAKLVYNGNLIIERNFKK
jgi:hypothetical protein